MTALLISSSIAMVFSIITSVITGFITLKMQRDDKDKHEYREKKEQEEKAKEALIKAQEQQKNESLLALMRIELMANYKRVLEKGYYTIEEREVYHPLFEAYHNLGGDGIIDKTRDEIIDLPSEPPKEK